MILHTLIKRGAGHKDFCEDFLFVHQTENYLVGGIFDGCSSGKESHFASTLFVKTFRMISKALLQNERVNNLLYYILYQSFKKLRTIQNELNLEVLELLSTINLMVIDKKESKVEVICVGDGFILLNGKQIEIDQDNRPDYAAYHFDKFIDEVGFRIWFDSQTIYQADQINDISISSDGIFSFVKVATDKEEVSPIELLLIDKNLIKNSAMLARKCNILKNNYGLDNYDDLSVIRVVNTE